MMKNTAAAGLSAGFSAGMVAPIDTLRVRWQLKKEGQPGSMLQFGRRILACEGLWAGLIRPGLGANVSAIAVCSGIRFGIYPTLRDRLTGGKSVLGMTGAGFISGAIGYWVSTPLWNWKTNAQARPELGAPAAREQPRAPLFRGAGALVVRGACLSAGGMLGYDGTKTLVAEQRLLPDGPALHLAASIVSAFCGTVLAAPADVCMTYVTTARARGQDFRGNLRALGDLVQARGLTGLYRGWPLFFLRMAPAFALNLTLYEQTRRLLGLAYFS